MASARLPPSVVAAGALLGTAGWGLLRREGPPLAPEAAAALALLLAILACCRPRTLVLAAAAGALGLARLPRPPEIPRPESRPVEVLGRLLERRPAADGGWLARLDRLRVPGGRPLGGAVLDLHCPRASPMPEAGTFLCVRGLLQRRLGGYFLAAADWIRAPGHRPSAAPLERLRDRVRQALASRLPPAEAGLGQALLLGDRRAVEDSRRQAFRSLGLLHLLAISGLHLWLWDALLRRLPGPIRGLRLPVLGLVALLAGGRPPVVRALVAIALRSLLARRGRAVRPSLLWAAALWTEVAVLPPRAADLGLLLSYTGTAGLIAARPPAGASWPRRLLQPSLAAFLATAPWLHAVQGSIEPWTVPLSPLFALGLPLRLLLLLPPALGLPGWHLAASALTFLGSLEAGLLSFLDGLPGSPWCLPGLSSLRLGLAAAASLAALSSFLAQPPRVLAGALALLALPFLGTSPAPAALVALPVGHGLGVLLGGSEGTLVFDLGSASRTPSGLVQRVLLPELARRHWAGPRWLVASHPDHDHGSALEMARRRLGGRRVAPPADGELDLGGLPARVRLLGQRLVREDGANHCGVLLELQRGRWRAVVLGDPQGAALRELRDRLAPGPVDILLLPHHGLTTAGLGELLDHLQPREAWASCGPGDLPLPAAPLLRRRGIRLRTTLDGPLAIELPGGSP